MSDEQRLDAFLERLRGDPDLMAFSIVIGPYRAMMRDPATVVAVIEAVIAHWNATATQEVKS